MSTNNVTKIGQDVISANKDILVKMIDAGGSDLFQGYASSIIVADLLHSGGFLSEQAYSAIFDMETIMAAIGAASATIGAIFGSASPFAPSLRTRIEMSRGAGNAAQKTLKSRIRTGKGDEEDDE